MIKHEPHVIVSVGLPLGVYSKITELAQSRDEKKLSVVLREVIQAGIEVIAAAAREEDENGKQQ